MIKVDEGNPISESFDLFMQAATLVQKYADKAFYKKAGISIIKNTILQILATAESPVTPSEISRRTLKVRHDITTLVKRMKRDGLIDIVPNPNDRRLVIIILTEKGREKFIQATPIAEEIANQVMSNISKTNLVSMAKTFSVLSKNSLDGLLMV